MLLVAITSPRPGESKRMAGLKRYINLYVRTGARAQRAAENLTYAEVDHCVGSDVPGQRKIGFIAVGLVPSSPT